MKFGVSLSCQNRESDWIRYDQGDFSAAPPIPDWKILEQNLHLADLVEPLGFDSFFSTEHHFSPHHMTPNGVQWLTYMAARTERIGLGTGLIVLPWHHPVRAAEEVLFLDNLLKGRDLYIGLGRGAALSEFKGLGIDLAESRDRFDQGVDVFRSTLTERHFNYQNSFFRGEGVTPRPEPFTPDLADRLYAGCTTESSITASANLGLRPMFVGAVGWEMMEKQQKLFNDIRASKGLDRSRAIVTQYTYCAPTAQEAQEKATQWIAGGFRTALKHYQHDKIENFRNVKGYEEYVPRAEMHHTADRKQIEGAMVNNCLWGSPEQMIERIATLASHVDCEQLVMVVNPGDTPVDEAERSMRLISEEVLPALRRMDLTKKYVMELGVAE
jgi:alkanesulfonate monooxygenase SsuD/methylene tetrahydromethanopterin reductase-like flavin-dependent oxidoreductase (luciferase family)